MAWKQRGVFLLVFATVLAYAAVLRCDFVSVDDAAYVVGNPMVRSGLTVAGLRWALGATVVGGWQPVTWLSHMLDVRLFELNPAGHHLTSLVLHAANTVLVFVVLRAMTGAHWRSLIVAALFALHPLHVESVAWVAERRDVLATFFGLLALWAYAGYARRPSAGRLLVVALPFALALGSDALLATLPLVMLLLDRWPLGRTERGWRLVAEKLPLLAMSAGAAGAAVLLAAPGTAGADVATACTPLNARLLNALVGSAWYVGKTVWPAELAVSYARPATWPPWQVGIAACIVCWTSVLAAITWRPRPWIAVGWLWFLVTLLPVSGLVDAGAVVADRFAYLPLVGLFVLVTWEGREQVARWPLRPPVTIACATMLLAALGLRTWVQVGYWQSSARLFSHALDVDPENWIAHNNLGDALARQGRFDAAVAEFSEALRLLPAYPDAQYNLGLALMRRGRTDEAIEHYVAALRLDPTSPNAHTTLGLALLGQGKDDEAVGHLTEALRVRPDAAAHFNLGFALARQGSTGRAIGHYREALRLAPDLPEAHYQLAQALAARGRRAEADEHYAAAIRLRPEWAPATAGRR